MFYRSKDLSVYFAAVRQPSSRVTHLKGNNPRHLTTYDNDMSQFRLERNIMPFFLRDDVLFYCRTEPSSRASTLQSALGSPCLGQRTLLGELGAFSAYQYNTQHLWCIKEIIIYI